VTAPRWVPCETHAHTVHSDGRVTVAELAQHARGLGLAAVALTDHNTISGHREIPEAERASGVTFVPGMELTTFYGHLLAWATTTYVDWRSLSRTDIDSAIEDIHAKGGLAGVAHPFNPGSPFCTGCFWDYDGPDWRHVDFLEVWSEVDPWKKPKNARALALWNDLLDQGYRIAGTGATDFHGPDPERLPSVTYLGVDDEQEGGGGRGGLAAAAREALRAGRVFVTLGPLLEVTARASGSRAARGPGGTIPRGDAGDRLVVDVAWGADDRRRLWVASVEPREIVVRGNRGELARAGVDTAQGSRELPLAREGHRWLRAELHGRARGDETMIAFTSPVYLEQP
jgi:hypothetical protein